jgi:acetyltransferase EpsM
MIPSGHLLVSSQYPPGTRIPMQPQPLLFLGDGPFAIEALDIAEAAGGFAQRPVSGSTLAGLPIFWIDDVPCGPGECEIVCAIVTTRRRAFIEHMRGRGYRFASLIHPSSSVSKRSRIRDGCILNAGVVVASNADIGEYTVVNRGALIGHDNRIGKCCTVGPGANIAGNVEIGDGTFVGQGAVIRERVKIGPDAVIAAGAVVLQDVRANDMVAGVPARVVRSGVNGY